MFGSMCFPISGILAGYRQMIGKVLVCRFRHISSKRRLRKARHSDI